MIASLRGRIYRQKPEEICIDVQGVGYRVFVPINVWETIEEQEEQQLYIHTYVREDRLDLYGFMTANDRTLFERLISMSGIGPKHALELMAVPKSLLMQAIGSQDAKLLTSVKGIGAKTAEKLLVDLKSLAGKQPEIFGEETGKRKEDKEIFIDQDVIDALKNLGYDTATIMQTLSHLPEDAKTTEQRVAAALRAL